MQILDIILALLQVKGIGRKKITSLAKKDLERIQTLTDFRDLCQSIIKRNIDDAECERYINSALYLREKHNTLGIFETHYFDDRYPSQLKILDSPPAVLFAKGNIDSLYSSGIAVIGTRHPSEKGKIIGEHFGAYLAKKGKTVISGMAIGCDSAAHTGCLNANGVTIAILASPLDFKEIKTNNYLAKRILEQNGCLVSEYPVGTPVKPYLFVDRDRLQAALADGTIVVETGEKSGTIHAVKETLHERKPLGCYRYSEKHYCTYPNSIGNKQLIASGEAKALFDTETIDAFLSVCDTPIQTTLF